MIGPETIQSRIKKNQRRAFVVGITYWVATLILVVLNVFPSVGNFTGYGTDGRVWIVSCLEPVLALMSGALTGKAVLHALASILYLLTFVFTFWNFVISTCKLFRITKKNPTVRHGYNRSSFAMRAMSKRYARSFFWVVASSVMILLLGDGSFTLFFYIALAVGLFFHFLGNLLGCKVSYFKTTEDKFKPEEIKREISRKLFALRNVVQFVAIALIVILMDRFGLIIGSLLNIVESDAMASMLSENLLDGLVLPAVLFLMMVCIVVCIRHATGITEYNSRGMKGKGMKTCRVCAWLIAILALAGAIVVLLVPEGTIVPKWAFLGILAIAVLWALSENMVVMLALGEEIKELTEKQKAKLAKKSAKKEKKAEKKAEKKNRKKKAEETVEEETETESQEETSETTEEAVEEPVAKDGEEPVEEQKSGESLEDLLDKMDENAEEFEEPSVETENLIEENNEENIEETSETTEEVVEEPVEEVAEETPVDDGLSETERKYRNELKQKWMDFASLEVEEEKEEDREDTDELIQCPTCQRKLRVKCGTEVAKCPACETKFVLKVKELAEQAFEETFEEDYEDEFEGLEEPDFDDFEEQENEYNKKAQFGTLAGFGKSHPTFGVEDFELDGENEYAKEAEAELRKLLYGNDEMEN